MQRIPRVLIHEDQPTRNNIVRYLEKTRCQATTSRVSDAARKELILTVNPYSFILFHYYVGKQNVPNFLFTDKQASRALGLSIKKVTKARKDLIKAGWFLQYNEYFDKKTNEYVIRTILGKDNIIKYMKNKSTREDNLKEMFG